MSLGTRYEQEKKLNIKKVIAVIVAILVIIMFIIAIKTLLTKNTDSDKSKQTSYYPVYTNQKWGVIDQTGKIIIEPTYEEMITIPDSKTDLFVCTYDVNYDENTYKTKVINSKNKEKFKGYDQIEAIENIDENNILWFEKGIFKVKKDNKYGLINEKEKLILEIKYDNIYALSGVSNSIIIETEGKKGLVDNGGNIIINPEYKEIKAIENDYKNGYIVINHEDKWGIIDITKKEVLEPKFEEIKQIASSNTYIVKQDGNLKAINRDGETLIENKFDDVKQITEGNIIFKKDNKYGIINTSNETKIEATYDDITYAFENYYIAKKDNKYGIINIENETKLQFEYNQISYKKQAGFIEATVGTDGTAQIINNQFEKKLEGIVTDINEEKGYFRIRQGNEYKYYNFKFEEKTLPELEKNKTLFLSKKDDKYGYVDKSGKEVVQHIYDDAQEQNAYGFAAVKKDGKWGAIDKKGKIVVEPTYELQNNILVNFIGKWHIGEDLNSYYYTDD